MNPDFSHLEQALNILYMPQGANSQQLMLQAQEYTQTFLQPYRQNLPALLSLYEDPATQKLQDVTKFWLLQAMVELMSTAEGYAVGCATIELRLSLHQKYLELLKVKPQLVMGAKHTQSKFALIFVHMARWDFPAVWPEAFQGLLSLMACSQEIDKQKKYLKFIVQVLLTLDEEMVDKGYGHDEVSNNVKDGIRAGPIGDICSLLGQALASYQAFDADTVNDCLQVAAQLIDWNALDTFSQIILISQQLLASLASDPSLLQFRKRAFQVLHAVVDKGMDYPLKVDVIVQLQYLEVVESLDLKYRDRLVNRLEEEQEEEEDFFSAVAFSINRVGQWCLELFMHHDKMLPSLEHQQRYENILTRLLKVSIRLLDTQKPLIGRKIVEFLSFWLQAIKKVEPLNEVFLQFLQEMSRVTIQRLVYPGWVKFKQEDMSDYEEDFMKYREELAINIFANIASIKQFNQVVLQMIVELLQGINPASSTFQQAELVLYLIYNLQQAIPSDLRENLTNNPYSDIVQYTLRVDYLSFKHKIVNMMFLENLVRYNTYLIKTPGFTQYILTVFFSEAALLSRDQELAQKSSYLFLRLCERVINSIQAPEETACYPQFVQSIVQLINTILTAKAGTVKLGSEEALNLYNVLSIFVSSKNVNAEVRSQTLVLVYSELYNRLTMLAQQAPAELDKVLWTLKFLNSFSKNFQPSQELIGSMKEYFEQVLQQTLVIMSANIRYPIICDQVMQYLQKCVSLLGVDSTRYLSEIGLGYIQAVEFDRLEVFVNLLSFASQFLKSDCQSVITQVYNPLFERVSQIQAPSSDTSDLDKTLLRGIASFIRLTHSTIENVELRNMGALPENLSAWLLHIFERHPDKSVRKQIAQIMKEIFVQLTNLKGQIYNQECLAQILGIGKKTLVASVAGTLAEGMKVDLKSLPPQHQQMIETALQLSTQSLFRLNPATLDDLTQIKVLSEIQLCFIYLGYGDHIRNALQTQAAQYGIQNTDQLVKIGEVFISCKGAQIKNFYDSYAKQLKEMRQK